MGSMGGSSGGGGVQTQAQAVPPAPIVYQSDDPYAANYRPPEGAYQSPAQRAATKAKADAEAAARTPLAPVETEEERLRRLRASTLILGNPAELLGGDGGSSGAADAGASDGSGAADGSAY